MVLRIDRLQDHTLKLVQWEIALERLTQKDFEPKAVLRVLGVITTIKRNRSCYKTNINIEVRKHSSSFTNEITVSYSWKIYHVCFELAPKETINEIYVVNTNSIHHHFPTEQGCLCNTFASTATTGLVGKGMDFGGVGGGVNMITQHIKFKIKIINIWCILYMRMCVYLHTHSLSSSPDAQNFVFTKDFLPFTQ